MGTKVGEEKRDFWERLVGGVGNKGVEWSLGLFLFGFLSVGLSA